MNNYYHKYMLFFKKTSIWFLDLLLTYIIYLSFHFVSYKTFILPERHFLFFIVFEISLLLSLIFVKKYSPVQDFKNAIQKHVNSLLLTLGFVALAYHFFFETDFSRYFVSKFILAYFSVSVILTLILSGKKLFGNTHLNLSLNIQVPILVQSFIPMFLFSAVVFFRYYSAGRHYWFLFASLYTLWIIVGLYSHQFTLDTNTNYLKAIYPYIRHGVLLMALMIFTLVFLRVETDFRNDFILFTFGYVITEIILMSYEYFKRRPAKIDDVKAKGSVSPFYNPDKRYWELVVQNAPKIKFDSFQEKLKNIFLHEYPELYNFINHNTDLGDVDVFRTLVINSAEPFNITVFPFNSLDFFLNLHNLNDIRRINKYLIDVNARLSNDGIYSGCFISNSYRFPYFLDQYPKNIAYFFYLFYFTWKRVIPKLPIVNKFYFGLTKGKNRALSRAEVFGRLYFCGFELCDYIELNYRIYFVAKKVGIPANDPHRSYGPLFKMKRVGKNGKIIQVYKFRTMHPFSEYLQKYMYEKYNLESGGKIKNDFRVTSLGKFFRATWLDEIPQFINLFKGELKLVGVRALSEHYFSLYPEEMKKLRKKVKPGMIPPFYVDLPKTFDEIIESERKYIGSYIQNPIQTDIKYFFKAMWNIVVKRARSA